MNEEEYLTRYEDNINTLNAILNKTKKLKNYINLSRAGIYLGITWGIMVSGIILMINENTSLMLINIILSIVLIIICSISVLYNTYRFKKYSKQFEITDSNTYDISVAYLISTLNISLEKFNFTLNDILKRHIELADCWWCNTDRVNVIKDELYKVLHIDKNNLEKSDLIVRKIQLQNEGLSIDNEHMKLQNESLSIDNEQKKFWTCQYCGNMNRGEDMSCIKCGANRT